MSDAQNSWHLQKSIPISLIVLLLAQAATFGWWGSRIQSRLEYVENNLMDHEALQAHGTVAVDLATIRTRQETSLSQTASVLNEIRVLSSFVNVLSNRISALEQRVNGQQDE